MTNAFLGNATGLGVLLLIFMEILQRMVASSMALEFQPRLSARLSLIVRDGRRDFYWRSFSHDIIFSYFITALNLLIYRVDVDYRGG